MHGTCALCARGVGVPALAGKRENHVVELVGQLGSSCVCALFVADAGRLKAVLQLAVPQLLPHSSRRI